MITFKLNTLIKLINDAQNDTIALYDEKTQGK